MNALEIERLAKEILQTTNAADIDFARFHEWASRANSHAVSYCPGMLDLVSKAIMHVAVLEDEAADDADYRESQQDDDRRDFRASPCNTGDYLEE